MRKLLAAALLLCSTPLLAQDARSTATLPPLPPWSGATRALIVPATDPWVTPSERTNLKATPTYDETFAYLRKLVAAAPQLKMVSIGKSDGGRDIWMVIASKDRGFTPEALRKSGKPVVFVQGGIHSGEIDGKDAGLMLLRDMTVRGIRRELLDRASLLFVPIFNVDGHERRSSFNRVNQRGPEDMGWRSNARNLNLNRDYMKADSSEMRAMLRALDTWNPDIYVDVHVTDGADYQYDVTMGWNSPVGHSPEIAKWMDGTFKPAVYAALEKAGHVPGPLVFGIGGDDLSKGIVDWAPDPRFSNGYGDARHLATILVENHSLKPYDQRVLGTYVFLQQLLETVGNGREELRRATAADRARRTNPVPLSWRVPTGAPPIIEFLGIESKTSLSPITGDVRTEWTGKPVTMKIPWLRAHEVATSISRPAAYWVPAAWGEVIERIAAHGVRFERITEPREIDVEMYRIEEAKLAGEAFEGHVRVTAKPVVEKRRETFPAGSIRIPTDQPLGTIAVMLLEPTSPDSFFQWGFFHSILNTTEYIEGYVMEPMAERMLAADPELRREFEKKVADEPEFRSSARARLQWLYRRTAFYDARARLYPVGRELR
ncbi:MAG: M14 family metallopeptidase [Thermoanaerobaculia bacterium]